METAVHFWKYLVKFFLEWEMFQTKVVERIHKEKSNKMQQSIKTLLLHIYMKLNMFRATHRPSSGA